MYTYKCSGPWITNDDRSSFRRRARWTVAKRRHKEGTKLSICLGIVLGDCGDSDDFKDNQRMNRLAHIACSSRRWK